MNKRIFLTIIIVSFLLTACGNTGSTNLTEQKKQSSSVSSTSGSTAAATSAAAAPEQTKSGAAATKSGSGTNNIKNIKGFTPFENQSFTVNLNSWGDVKFVSGKLTAGDHIPAVFYLTNQNGDILYSFEDTPFPYSVDVKAVSFADVNKDGLKDIIIIVTDAYKGSGSFGKPIAAVWLQNTNKTFTCDTKLYQEINESGNNKDIKTVTDYLSKKF